MLKNYLKIAFRNLVKNTLYSIINLGGLSFGIACSILIFLWVLNEVTYDSFLPRHDRLYRVMMNQTFDGKVSTQSPVSYPVKDAVKAADPNVVNTVMMNWGSQDYLAYQDKKIKKDGYHVSPEFLTMFEYEIVEGQRETALNDLSSIVLTSSAAKAIFGEEDPINKTVRINNEEDLKVTAVIKDPPANATFQFSFLATHERWERKQSWIVNARDNWRTNGFQVFAELKDPAYKESVESKISGLVVKNIKPEEAFNQQLFLHPMTDWRLYSTFENGKSTGGRIEYVRLFSIIAVLILAMACINFMNLTTARSEKRSREVGIRKSMGSTRKQLIGQHIGESIMLCTGAFMIAIVLVELFLPVFNSIVSKKLFIEYNNPVVWLVSVIFVLVTGILAGSYPAFYLSSFNPVKVLKGNSSMGGKGLSRKVLVTLQFCITIILLTGVFVIYQQINYVKNREIGYDKENIISVAYAPDIYKSFPSIKQELLNLHSVSSVCQSGGAITAVQSSNPVEWPGMDKSKRVLFTTTAAEYDYTKTLNIEMVMGRDFSPEFPSDSSAVLINQAALDLMGVEDPLGMQVQFWGETRHIVGVTSNIVMDSPFEPVEPAIIAFMPGWVNTYYIKLNNKTDVESALADVSQVFKKYNSYYPFEYAFVDDQFNRKYSSIELIGKLANLFSILTIVISGLGLLGLASFSAEQRTKEIGIRKVLGASVRQIVSIFTKDFSKITIVAFLLAAPIAWWALNSFLEQYPYRIDLPVWIIPAAGLLVFIFSILIVVTQTLKAALTNPADTLHSE